MSNKQDLVADRLQDYRFYRAAAQQLGRLTLVMAALVVLLTASGVYFKMTAAPAGIYATRPDGRLYPIRGTESLEQARERSREASISLRQDAADRIRAEAAATQTNLRQPNRVGGGTAQD